MNRSERPNVLLLFADQHNAQVMSCAGHPDAATPRLDQLAREGTRFTAACCQNAICAPSRNSLFSGLYPRTLGCLDNGMRGPAMQRAVSMQEAFRRNGYRTAAFGKRHLDLACDGGWDIRESHLYKESPGKSYPEWVDRMGDGAAFSEDWAAEFGRSPRGVSKEQELPFSLLAVRPSALPENRTMEAFTAERTKDFLERQKDSDQPFFCFASFYRPHQPYTPLPAYWERLDRTHWGRGTNAGDGIHMPDSLRQPPEELPPMLQAWFRGENRVWRLDLARQDEQLYRDYIAAYCALVMEIDSRIGDILDTLEQTGQRDNTIVLYAADHGDFVGAHGMVEKCAPGHNVYIDTLRVPLIVSWPKSLRQEAVCGEPAALVDLYPTLLELCGCKRPESDYPLAGRSLAPMLQRGEPTGRRFVVSENGSQTAVVTPRYTYGRWNPPVNPDRDFRAFGDMLFDRQADPSERHNCLNDPAYQAVLAEMKRWLAEWESTVSDEGRRAVMSAGGR